MYMTIMLPLLSMFHESVSLGRSWLNFSRKREFHVSQWTVICRRKGLNNAHHVLGGSVSARATHSILQKLIWTVFREAQLTNETNRRFCWAFIWKSYLLGNVTRSLWSAIQLLVKAFSWRAVSEKFEKFQPTISRKSLDSVLEQLHRF